MTVRARQPGHAARSHSQRLEVLEKKSVAKSSNPEPGWVYWEQTFSQDTVAVAASGRYYPPFTGEIYETLATLKTAGTSTTTVVVKVNGGTQATINLASSDQYELAQLDDTLRDDTDYVTVETTAVGAGAAGLVVTVRFRRRA